MASKTILVRERHHFKSTKIINFSGIDHDNKTA